MYCDIQDVKNYALFDWENSWDSQIESWIEQMTAYVNNYTGRNFEAESGTRYFDGNGKRELLVDDFIELETLKIDDVAISTADLLLYPANKDPKFKIYYESGFSKDKQNVEVVAE